MSKNDWIGIGTSIAVHALLLLFVFVLPTQMPDPEPIGFIEVEVLGPVQYGRPARQAAPPDVEQPEMEPQVTPRAPSQPSAPRESRDVNLPKEQLPNRDPETVQTPKTDVISPERDPRAREDRRTEESQPRQNPAESGSSTGTSGQDEASEGDNNQPVRSAPYSLEGLNRTPVRAPLPRNSENANAIIQMRITVNPQGRVVATVPLRKSNPELERQVAQVLRTWQFNALPPAAPQENQTGTITFRFVVQ